MARREPSARRRVAVAHGSLAAIAVVLSALLLALIANIVEVVASMRRDEQAMHEGLMLGVAVREQYIHEAHTLIERTDTHLDHHHGWVRAVARSAAALEHRVPKAHQWRVARIAATSTAIDALFRTRIVPAVRADDLDTLRIQHRRIDALVTRASGDADAVAAALEQRMRSEHIRAETSARTAVLVAGVGGLLALVLAAQFGWSVRRRVLRPLGVLADWTRMIARGEVPDGGIDGDAEVRAVAAALRQLVLDLREREVRLLASERLAAVGQLAAGVAHEVNNPIGIIRGYLRTMIPEAHDATLRDELRILDEEAQSCQRIAEDLVAFARIGELRLAELDLAVLTTEVARRLEASGELHGAQVTLAVEPAAVLADATRIRQLLANLLRNASEASRGGSIEISGRVDDAGYRLEVGDRGPGVPEAARERIFEPFFGDRADGAGLGLAVCRGIVQAHGGSIRVEERKDGGASFVVNLPRRAEVRA